MKPTLLIDILLAAILLASVAIGARRGAFKAISGLAGTLAGYWGALKLGGAAAPLVARVIRPATLAVVERAARSSGVSDILDSTLTGELLGAFRRLAEALGLSQELGASIQAGAQETGARIVNAMTDGIVAQLAPLLAFLLVFLAVRWAVVLALGLLSWDRLPIIRSINRLGGALLGALSGLVVVLVLCWAVFRFAPEQGPGGLDRRTLRESHIGSAVSRLLETGSPAAPWPGKS